ncbi:4716_t:CDS:2 [Entrophospora sp. SA101]|nr:11926_t:CDS:2 [Entrophospora sp. SA101]CAJ0748793.1 20887_t:CDS:2 [Entrophospora sp. SA101]CAJ0754186.1 4716_t:CDS:2 [Entrophospora sp. SA101]CAJ0835410.1 6175_t:CDS:2 [Entrophospora sp. SA101]
MSVRCTSLHFLFPTDSDARSPCPALNYITICQLMNGLMKGFNLSRGLAIFQTLNTFSYFGKIFKNKLSLADLHQHNKLEHDASITRIDKDLGPNWEVNHDLINLFLGQQQYDGKITKDSFMKIHKIRYNDSKSNNTKFTYEWKQNNLAFGEYSLFLTIIGAATNNEVDVDCADSILRDERIPSDWKFGESSITLIKLLKFQKYLETQYKEKYGDDDVDNNNSKNKNEIENSKKNDSFYKKTIRLLKH